MAERLFGQANIKPIWASTPSREEILKQDKIRIVDNAMLKEPIKEDEQEFVDLLVSKNTVEQLAAAYYRLLGKDLSAPEDLRNPSDRDEGRSKGNGFQKSVWFELSVGRDDTAEPRWLVAMLCKAGNLSKRDIGSIKIQPKVTNIEISEETSSALKQLASNRKPIERHIMIRLLDKPPEGANSDRGRPDRNRSSRGKPDYNRANEGRSRDFKGKGKSDRWQSSEKKKSKPKFSPFADNYIQQDENRDNEPQDKLKSSSRRGKQKESYGNADRNHNKNDFKDKRNNKKVKPKSKNERLPNFENNFNEEDKLKEFNANREKKSFKGKKSNNDTLRISKKNKDIKSTAKSKFPKPKKSD
jgi:ATP-dependent RNA helicase DeaD